MTKFVCVIPATLVNFAIIIATARSQLVKMVVSAISMTGCIMPVTVLVLAFMVSIVRLQVTLKRKLLIQSF